MNETCPPCSAEKHDIAECTKVKVTPTEMKVTLTEMKVTPTKMKVTQSTKDFRDSVLRTRQYD